MRLRLTGLPKHYKNSIALAVNDLAIAAGRPLCTLSSRGVPIVSDTLHRSIVGCVDFVDDVPQRIWLAPKLSGTRVYLVVLHEIAHALAPGNAHALRGVMSPREQSQPRTDTPQLALRAKACRDVVKWLDV